MLSRFCRKLGCYLGLLAILMATLAPTVSHALAAAHEAAHHPDAACAGHAMHGTMPAGDDHSHSLAGHWQACGYCSLLAHLPVLPGIEPSFAVTIGAVRHRVAVRVESVRRVEPRAFGLPRAPPVSS